MLSAIALVREITLNVRKLYFNNLFSWKKIKTLNYYMIIRTFYVDGETVDEAKHTHAPLS